MSVERISSGASADAQIDVEKSASHQLSQSEIASDNPCSQQLSASVLAGLHRMPASVDCRSENSLLEAGRYSGVGIYGHRCVHSICPPSRGI